MLRGYIKLRNRKGAAMVEYALLAALIALAAAATLGLLGGDITSVFEDIRGALTGS